MMMLMEKGPELKDKMRLMTNLLISASKVKVLIMCNFNLHYLIFI